MLGNVDKQPVVIVSSQGLIADLLCRHLNSLERYAASYVGDFFRAEKFVGKCTEKEIALLDVSRIDIRTRGQVEGFVKKHPNSKSIVLSAPGMKEFVFELFSLGVSGYIPYSTPVNTLPAILDVVGSGEKYMPIEVEDSEGVGSISFAQGLTAHEAAMLKYLGEGMSNKEIARTIKKSEVSVKLYMTTLFQKIGAKNRTHALVIAFRKGYL